MADFDAVVVGGSLAGCTAATLLARSGARVALVERQPDPDAFKRICGHFIQSSAVATFERLGVMDELMDAGAVRTRFRLWTPWGWIDGSDSSLPAGLNLRRERLDPLLRRFAAETPGVELLLGQGADGLLWADGAACGVELRDRQGARTTLRAPLVVGADGRSSRVAELAGVRSRRSPHGRFAYAAYYEGPPPAGAPNATLWFTDPQWVASFPTDDGLTMYGAMPTKDRLPEFRRDLERAFTSFVADVPEAPPILESKRIGPMLGKIDLTNVIRASTGRGLALIGDAALATDPLWGVGCGWAAQTGEWLADAVTPALRGEEALATGLTRYRRHHRRRLHPHAQLIHDYATGRRMRITERLMYAAGARDRILSERLEAFGTRNIGPARFIASALPRVLAVNARVA